MSRGIAVTICSSCESCRRCGQTSIHLATSVVGMNSTEVSPSRFQTMHRDVLLEIFTHCLPYDNLPRPSICHAPLLLGRICSHWRHVALSTATLWSRLRVGLDDRGCKVGDRLSGVHDLEALREFMARSKDMPVSLSLIYFNVVNKFAPVDIQMWEREDLISELVLHRERWKSLELSVPCEVTPPVLSAFTQGVPLLENFRFITDHLPVSIPQQ